jgi:hypothetical protein
MKSYDNLPSPERSANPNAISLCSCGRLARLPFAISDTKALCAILKFL